MGVYRGLGLPTVWKRLGVLLWRAAEGAGGKVANVTKIESEERRRISRVSVICSWTAMMIMSTRISVGDTPDLLAWLMSFWIR